MLSPIQQGKILAFLYLSDTGQKPSDKRLDAEELNALQILRDRLQQLRHSQSNSIPLDAHFSELTCEDLPCICRKPELLLQIFILDAGKEPEAIEENRQYFFKWINSCFTCFQEFSDIMRGYNQVLAMQEEPQHRDD